MWENINSNISVMIGTYLEPYMETVTVLVCAYLELFHVGSYDTIIFRLLLVCGKMLTVISVF